VIDSSQQVHLRADKQKKLNVIKTSVQKLWDALEVDQEEKNRFLNSVHSGAHDPVLIYQLYERECSKLTDKLPLMQSVTRREFLKHRM
jgi:hypothetical protein